MTVNHKRPSGAPRRTGSSISRRLNRETGRYTAADSTSTTMFAALVKAMALNSKAPRLSKPLVFPREHKPIGKAKRK